MTSHSDALYRAQAWPEMHAICQRAWQIGVLWGYNGNVSLRTDAPETFVITSTHSPKGHLQESDLSVLHAHGEVSLGKPASSEKSLHLAIYAALPETKAILHCHPRQLLALSVRLGFTPQGDARWKEDFLRLPLFEASVWRDALTFVPAHEPGSNALADAVAHAAQHSAALWLEGHGLCCHARSLRDCLAITEQLEHLAATQLLSMSV